MKLFSVTMDKYRAIFSIGLQNTFVYRWNFLLRSLFALVPLFGTVFVWRAIYGDTSGTIAGYDFGQMIFYFLVVLLVDNLITPTEDEWQIAAEIREGQLSSLLLKPFDFLAYRSCIFIGSRMLYTAVTLLPVVAVFCWYRQFLQLPAHASTWGFFAVSLVMARDPVPDRLRARDARLLDPRDLDGCLHSLLLRVFSERKTLSP
jgi:ABC-2 type transport system permease protein